MQLSRKITAFLAGAAFLAPMSALADDDEDCPPTPAQPAEPPPVTSDATPYNQPVEPPPPAPAPQPQPQPTTVVETPDSDVDVNVYTTEEVAPFSYGWTDPRLVSDIGIAVQIGGGVGGFTGETMNDIVTSDVQGLWGVKATIGSHIPLGLDLSYTGSASDIDSLVGFSSGATLIGTALEGSLRWNILPRYELNPYIFGGLGWQRYDVTDGDFTLAANGMEDSDNSLVVPMGAGLAWRDPSGLVLDLHGTFRWNTNGELALSATDLGDFASMHTWEATANIGFEF